MSWGPTRHASEDSWPHSNSVATNSTAYSSAAAFVGLEIHDHANATGMDYHFHTRSQIESLRANNRYVLLDVRGDLQALDLENVHSLPRSGDVFFEGNPFVGVTKPMDTHLDGAANAPS